MSSTALEHNPRVLLSRNELEVILRVLEVGDLPGLESDPLGELTAEQRAYGLIVAERSLRARELARTNEAGKLLIHREVLELVGACGLSEGTLVVTTARPADATGAQWYGHRLGETCVVHSLPDLALHQFTQVADRTALVQLIGASAGWPDCPAAPISPVTLAGDVIASARTMAPQDQAAAATALKAAGAESVTADALAATFASPYGVTVVQAIHRRDANTVAAASVSILYNDAQLWLMTEIDSGASQFDLRTATRPQVETLIQQMEW
jgi:hypothetical protein